MLSVFTIDQLIKRSSDLIADGLDRGWSDDAVVDLGLYVEEMRKRSVDALLYSRGVSLFAQSSGCQEGRCVSPSSSEALYLDLAALAAEENVDAVELLSNHMDALTINEHSITKEDTSNRRCPIYRNFNQVIQSFATECRLAELLTARIKDYHGRILLKPAVSSSTGASPRTFHRKFLAFLGDRFASTRSGNAEAGTTGAVKAVTLVVLPSSSSEVCYDVDEVKPLGLKIVQDSWTGVFSVQEDPLPGTQVSSYLFSELYSIL